MPRYAQEVENDGRNGHTECIPFLPPRYERIRPNRAKSGQGMGVPHS